MSSDQQRKPSPETTKAALQCYLDINRMPDDRGLPLTSIEKEDVATVARHLDAFAAAAVARERARHDETRDVLDYVMRKFVPASDRGWVRDVATTNARSKP